MNTNLLHKIKSVPPGHEKVSDDLLIYTFPEWDTHPDDLHSGSDARGFGARDAFVLIACGALVLLVALALN
jgi:hypothetical protein